VYAGGNLQTLIRCQSGTWEITLAHGEPLLAVDDFVRAQDIIKTIGYKRGLHITMTPRPFAADDPFYKNRTATQGTHAHISINPTVHEEKFLAGILNNYPLLCAFGMASIDSYFRSDNEIEQAAGHWVGWGYQNRYIPVRKVDTGHWELRQADATANMYLVIATTLAAGLHGIEMDQVLTWKDCQRIPSTMTAQEREEHCMTTRVPTSLQESLGILETQKAVLAPYIAPPALQAYENVKRKELEVLGNWTLAERRKLYMRVF
jgi:glutamine synthetase